jgi:potassium/hydrogen antiporter
LLYLTNIAIFITPNGQTELKAEDELMIMMENEHQEEEIKALLFV